MISIAWGLCTACSVTRWSGSAGWPINLQPFQPGLSLNPYRINQTVSQSSVLKLAWIDVRSGWGNIISVWVSTVTFVFVERGMWSMLTCCGSAAHLGLKCLMNMWHWRCSAHGYVRKFCEYSIVSISVSSIDRMGVVYTSWCIIGDCNLIPWPWLQRGLNYNITSSK